MRHGIEWLNFPGRRGETWNPWGGCSAAGPGCKNCWACRQANRFKDRHPKYAGTVKDGNWTGIVNRASPDEFFAPMHWRDPRTIFPCSMSDFFHPEADAWRKAALRVMYECPQHLFLIPTKRPERIGNNPPQSAAWPFPNVWLGASVEDADHLWRVEKLLNTPATKRFLSLEPLLGPIDCEPFLDPFRGCDRITKQCIKDGLLNRDQADSLKQPAISWVIVGGESGPGARPMHPDWVRKIRDQCQAAGVPFFFKQWGEWTLEDAAIDLLGYTPLRDLALFSPDDTGITSSEDAVIFSKHLSPDRWENWHNMDFRGADDVYMVRVGKKKAGRILDGRTWGEMP